MVSAGDGWYVFLDTIRGGHGGSVGLIYTEHYRNLYMYHGLFVLNININENKGLMTNLSMWKLNMRADTTSERLVHTLTL